jgi:hypothetical protein
VQRVASVFGCQQHVVIGKSQIIKRGVKLIAQDNGQNLRLSPCLALPGRGAEDSSLLGESFRNFKTRRRIKEEFTIPLILKVEHV